MPLILSLFPGIGLLDMAFEEAGFCVVRGPDLLWGGNVKHFHPPAGKFDGVIGGPPCQIFSRMRHIQPKAGQRHGNLIPEFERVVIEAQPDWFLMENVPESPGICVPGYGHKEQEVCDHWCGGLTKRKRLFVFGQAGYYKNAPRFFIETLALHAVQPDQAALAGGARRVPVKLGGSGKVKASRRVCAGDSKTEAGLIAARRAQGLPADFLAEDTPFTVAGKIHAIGNGVPLAMGRAVASAVRRALEPRTAAA